MATVASTGRRVRVAIVGASPCGGCGANCCKQNGHEFAVLLRGDEVRRFAAFSVDVRIEGQGGGVVSERVLPYAGGRCQFLGEDDRCTIYEDRPASCREFECVRYFNSGGMGRHGRFLELNSDVLGRLEGW
jgi:Fe-S-cluster containining protein